MDPTRLSSVASALAPPTRAGIVAALMDGTAHTGRELARHVGLAPSTISEHLGLLLDAGLVAVEAQGRHRYYRLASAQVAALVEAAAALDGAVAPMPGPRVPAGLVFARSCYDHLAGELGVRLYERLLEVGALTLVPEGLSVSSTGRELLGRLGIDLGRPTPRPAVRACLDWSQRRHHLAGLIGAELLTTLLERGWLRRTPRSPRELRLTPAGRSALASHFGLEVA